jgi:type IX secretion system PorP/SprF family membrane protein
MNPTYHKYHISYRIHPVLFLLIFIFQFSVFTATAQQAHILNQSLVNPYLLNPAYAGLNSYTQLFLTVRNQWHGMPGAPFFCSFSADGQLRSDKSGLGFILQNDRQPMIQNITGMLTYRHLVRINSNHSIRLALSGGLLHNSINLTGVDAASPGESTLMEKDNSRAAFDVNAGIIYRFKKLELGFASLQLSGTDYSYINSATGDGLTYRLIRYFNAGASYRFDTGKEWSVIPSAILYSTHGMPAHTLASCKVEYMGDYWLAGSYRTGRSVAVSLGMVISGRLNVGYSFESAVSRYGSALGNTHEITVGIRLFGRNGEPASRREVSRREVEQLSDIIRLQSQRIDELVEETVELKDDAAQQHQRYDSQRAELEALIALTAEQAAAHREETERLKDESVSPAQIDEEQTHTTEAGRYAVVVGAYTRLDDAKLYQKILERELGLVTWIRERQGGKVRFLVYSSIVRTGEEALTEYDRLYDLGIERYRQGELWLYRFK